jgi:hypothetical protein
MSKRYFRVILTGEATIELDDAVIKAVTDEWRDKFYRLASPADIAQHVSYNLIVNGVTLSMLDGWADQADSNAHIIDQVDWDIEAEEI